MLKRRPQEHTTFYSIIVFVIDDEKENVGCDDYKVHQEPIICFDNQKKKRLKKCLELFDSIIFFPPIPNSQEKTSRESTEPKTYDV